MPLAEIEYEDVQVWKGELFGEFSVHSTYKLLQEATLNPTSYLLQTKYKEFYRKLWGLQLPPKITMTIWRISWDYIPNFVNLRCRKVITNDECPRCRSWFEESLHVFWECPKATIQFDAAFDRRSSKSATGLVGWDQKGDLLVLKTVVHNNVSSSFVAEAYTCLESIKLGISLRMLSIKIMGDSRTVIKKCWKLH